MRTKQQWYHGWWIVLTCVLLMGLVYAPMLTLPGVFTVPVTEEFEVKRTVFNLHISICLAASTAAALFVGKAFERYPAKPLMSLFTVITGLCFGAYSLAENMVHFYVISGVLGFAGRFLTYVPVSILVTSWFGPRIKGKVMGAAMAGSGIGAMVLNPVLSAVITNWNWQTAYRLLALLVLCILLPMVLLTIADTPADKGLERLGDEPRQEGPTISEKPWGLTSRQALRMPLFWMMFLTFCLFSITCTIFNNNAIPSMVDCGMDPVTASTVMSISAFGIVLGKLLLGAISDRWSPKAASAFSILCLMGGLSFFLILPQMFSFLTAAVGAFLFGVGNANCTVCMPLITSDLMGTRDFGVIFGYASVSSSMGAAVGPLLGSMVFDTSGSYAGAWAADILLAGVMLLLLFLCYHMGTRLHGVKESSGSSR